MNHNLYSSVAVATMSPHLSIEIYIFVPIFYQMALLNMYRTIEIKKEKKNNSKR